MTDRTMDFLATAATAAAKAIDRPSEARIALQLGRMLDDLLGSDHGGAHEGDGLRVVLRPGDEVTNVVSVAEVWVRVVRQPLDR